MGSRVQKPRGSTASRAPRRLCRGGLDTFAELRRLHSLGLQVPPVQAEEAPSFPQDCNSQCTSCCNKQALKCQWLHTTKVPFHSGRNPGHINVASRTHSGTRLLLPVVLHPRGVAISSTGCSPSRQQIEVEEKVEKAHCSQPGGLEWPVSLLLPLFWQEQGTQSHLEAGGRVSRPPVPKKERAPRLESGLWVLEGSLNTRYDPLEPVPRQ